MYSALVEVTDPYQSLLSLPNFSFSARLQNTGLGYKISMHLCFYDQICNPASTIFPDILCPINLMVLLVLLALQDTFSHPHHVFHSARWFLIPLQIQLPSSPTLSWWSCLVAAGRELLFAPPRPCLSCLYTQVQAISPLFLAREGEVNESTG